MLLNLQQDIKTIRTHLAKRIKDYPIYINDGPGHDEDPITQITIGFDYLQGGWLAIIFDTRPKSEFDGQWNNHIEGNALDMPHWERFFDKQFESKQCQYIDADGKTKKIKAQGDEEALAGILGNTLASNLSDWYERGAFRKLPIADNCLLSVEHSEGAFGWTNREREETDEDRLLAEAAALPKNKQIDFWVGVLGRVASGEVQWPSLIEDLAMENLEPFGKQTIIPLLMFVNKWSTQEEFTGDRPKRKFDDAPHSSPTFSALHAVYQAPDLPPEAEKMLHEIARKSIQANAKRRLWGTMPAWAARCLHEQFTGYPEPIVGDSDNRLKNAESFTRKPK